MTGDETPDTPAPETPRLGGGDDDDESLRPFIVALAALVGAVAVATLVALLSYPLGKRFARRHPVWAEVLNVGRR
jgi:hypothetical protein